MMSLPCGILRQHHSDDAHHVIEGHAIRIDERCHGLWGKMSDTLQTRSRAVAPHRSIEGWLRVSIVAPDEFAGDLLEYALQCRGITTLSRSAQPAAAPTLVSAGSELVLRVVTLTEIGADLAELTSVRTEKSTVGLVVLLQARDHRLLGIDLARLPVGTRVVTIRDIESSARLAELICAVARHPLALQRTVTRLPLTDEQVVALRSIAAGLSNDQLAAERTTTVSAARRLVARTALALGIPNDMAPAQMRAAMAATHVRLLGGGDIAWRPHMATAAPPPPTLRR